MKYHNPKSQAALEFLMTYGWAILVMLITISALYYFGILNPKQILPDRCNFGSEIDCIDFTMSLDTLVLRIKNSVGDTIIVDSFSIDSGTATPYDCTTPPTTPFTLSASQTTTLQFTGCNGASIGFIQGDKKKLSIIIDYHLATSPAAYTRKVSGEVFGIVASSGTPPPLNNPPTITLASDSPDPVTEGSPITLVVNWNDIDAEGIKMFICKSDSISVVGPSCPGGIWCSNSATFSLTDPISCPYTTTGPDVGTNNYFAFVCDDEISCSSSSSGTFTVDPAPVGFSLPGRLQAEDYNLGGEGTGYHDTTSGNSGGQYRTDNVDIEIASDTGGGFNVGWIAAGEWLNFDVNVAATGIYDITARVASNVAGTKTLHIEIDGSDVTGPMSFTDSSGWQSWLDVTVTGVSLTAGNHVLRIFMDTSFFNVNYVDVS